MADEKTNKNPQGYYFDQKACIGCRTCQIACKDKNDLEVGILFRKVLSFEVGAYPETGIYHYSGSCNHCENPACVEVCPNQAMYIDEEDGTVQHDDSKCIGCEYCVKACPYGHPQYIADLRIVHKCDGCIGLRSAGERPACVSACPMRALDFGPISDLRAAHPDTVNQIAILPDASQTNPSVAINSRSSALEQDYKQMIM